MKTVAVPTPSPVLLDAARHQEFIVLLQALLNDPQQKKQVLDFLDLRGEPRLRAINILLTTMRKDQADPQVIRAWEFLADDEIAECAREILRGHKPAIDWKERAVVIICAIGIVVFVTLIIYTVLFVLKPGHRVR